GRRAKEPGLVPSFREEGLGAPWRGRGKVEPLRFIASSQRFAGTRTRASRFPTPARTGSGSTGTSQRQSSPEDEAPGDPEGKGPPVEAAAPRRLRRRE